MGGGDIDAGSISPPASLDVREKNDDVARPTGFLYVPQSRVVDSRFFFSALTTLECHKVSRFYPI